MRRPCAITAIRSIDGGYVYDAWLDEHGRVWKNGKDITDNVDPNIAIYVIRAVPQSTDKQEKRGRSEG